MKRTQKMQENGLRLQGKTIIGIDPAINKHQAVILRPDGSVSGRSFSFETNHTGFTETLPRRIRARIKATDVVYAIEGSCALWQNLAFHLSEQGQEVVLTSPLATYHARPSITGDFLRTDQKDAELIARLAQQGSYKQQVRTVRGSTFQNTEIGSTEQHSQGMLERGSSLAYDG